ncbi:MAG: exonuclease [Rivularia sp. (in: cyanobacteria)]
MKSTYINQGYHHKQNNLPSVTTVLKSTQSPKSLAALSSWRKTIGKTKANQIVFNSFRCGKALHKIIQEHLQGNLSKPTNKFIEPYWNSIQPVLNELSDIQLIEKLTPNYQENYSAKVDLVARYKGIPHVIEWTTSEKPKFKVENLYDKPLQLVAYGGAINRYYGENLFGCNICSGLIVVALPDREAEIFEFDRASLIDYWKMWYSRLKLFYNLTHQNF